MENVKKLWKKWMQLYLKFERLFKNGSQVRLAAAFNFYICYVNLGANRLMGQRKKSRIMQFADFYKIICLDPAIITMTLFISLYKHYLLKHSFYYIINLSIKQLITWTFLMMIIGMYSWALYSLDSLLQVSFWPTTAPLWQSKS